MFNLLREVHDQAKGAETVEESAKKAVDLLFQSYSDSLVLLRVYVTMPFEKPPPFNRAFVEKLSLQLGSALKPTTPVLSLMASRGAISAWDDRSSMLKSATVLAVKKGQFVAG